MNPPGVISNRDTNALEASHDALTPPCPMSAESMSADAMVIAGRSRAVELNTYITRLMDRGFNYAEAHTWRYLGIAANGHHDLALALPCEYRDAGFTPREGSAWFTTYLLPEQAVDYANNGWTPRTVRMLRRVIHETDGLGTEQRRLSWGGGAGDERPVETEWIHAGIPPHYVFTYICGGITPDPARDLDARRRHGDTTVEPALITLAALRSTTP